METININGTEYVKASDVCVCESSDSWEHVCVIATNGWIFEGCKNKDLQPAAGGIYLANAHVVRSWSNGRGIGALADPKYKDEYILDPIGAIEVLRGKIISVFKLRW